MLRNTGGLSNLGIQVLIEFDLISARAIDGLHVRMVKWPLM